MRVSQFRISVPVRAAADREPQAGGDLREPLLDRGRVTRVPHLDAVQALLLELSDLALGPVVAKMRRDGEPADGVDELRHLTEHGQRLLDVPGLAATEVARERL